MGLHNAILIRKNVGKLDLGLGLGFVAIEQNKLTHTS